MLLFISLCTKEVGWLVKLSSVSNYHLLDWLKFLEEGCFQLLNVMILSHQPPACIGYLNSYNSLEWCGRSFDQSWALLWWRKFPRNQSRVLYWNSSRTFSVWQSYNVQTNAERCLETRRLLSLIIFSWIPMSSSTSYPFYIPKVSLPLSSAASTALAAVVIFW